VVGYHVQTAVAAKHHLIVTHEVTNQGTDRSQLAAMGKQTQEAIGTEKRTALADRGYCNGEEILACEQAGINALVPKSYTSNNLAKGQFDKRDVHYNAGKDEYRCPAGQRAIWRFKGIERGFVSRVCSTRRHSKRCKHGWRRCRRPRAMNGPSTGPCRQTLL
jgi:transposase